MAAKKIDDLTPWPRDAIDNELVSFASRCTAQPG